jgi:hypothetical protein
MNHKDLKQLQTLREYPALSILAPTHRTAPANAQDPIRIKNLVTEATARLLDEFPKREVESLLEMLNGLVEEIDWRYTLDGIALFVSPNFAARFDLPFSVQERVAIDETSPHATSCSRSTAVRATGFSTQRTADAPL